ncbi:MAG TPA: multicopper oxidase domain-containing protein [Candidatus Thermoplasmatota archaeon]|nr:multicopper oxidase domain-containing protein [Candidatus Thermoplasmatota archaeon]
MIPLRGSPLRPRALLLVLILAAVPVLAGCVGADLHGADDDHGADGHTDTEAGHTANDGHNDDHGNGTLEGPLLAKGQSWEATFTTLGTFKYHCHPHPFMEGEIVVSATDPAARDRVEVTMQNFKFTPERVVVKPGGTVKWTNLDSVAHNVVAAPAGAADPHAGHGGSTSFTSIDRSTAGLPASKPTQEVRLKHGDTFDLTAGLVTHDPGTGKPIQMWAYNGQIPGPTLRIPEGANVTINFKNNLPVETTVHWHGLRLDPRFDGVPHLSQKPVPPGGVFRYVLSTPDAGVYWYHPHVREDIQQELGLAGVILVDGPRDPSEPWPREFVVALDDIKLENGDVATMWREEVNHAIMGRYGNQTLANGKPTVTLEADPGERVRLHFVNIANARPIKVVFTKNTTVQSIGADAGYYKAPKPYGHAPTISPGERITVDVIMPTNGSTVIFSNEPHGMPPVELGRLVASKKAPVATIPAPLSPHNLSRPEMGPALQRSNTTVDIEWVLDFWMDPAHMAMMNMNLSNRVVHTVEYVDNMSAANAEATPDMLKWIIRDNATLKENKDLHYTFKQGDIVRIRIKNLNTTMHPMQHPIHIHGQRFLVDSTNGRLNTDPVWKDVVTVPAGSEMILTVEMSNPGTWVFHCHINEHLETGMEGMFTVK